MNWSKDQIATLTAGWLAGLPSAEIGRQLGVTSSAVRSKRDHLRLASRAGEVGMEACRQAGLSRGRGYLAPPPRPPKGIADAALMLALSGSTPRPWAQRRFGECPFPVGGPFGETLSCCLPRDGTSKYCLRHREIMRLTPPGNGLNAGS